MTLLWRVIAINTGLLLAATAALVVSPATVSATLTIAELGVLALGIVIVTAINVLLLRRVFGPLERLASLMRRVEPGQPGRRLTVERPVAEVADLARAFNDMLDRLERERLSSGRRALAAQERERRRLARELHDELGQVLTVWVEARKGRASPVVLGTTLLLVAGVAILSGTLLLAADAGTTLLTALLALPAAWVSTLGRGLLAGIATSVTTLVAAQVMVVAGTGAWFPPAAPTLWAVTPETVTAAQLSLVPAVSLAFTVLTTQAWAELQLDR